MTAFELSFQKAFLNNFDSVKVASQATCGVNNPEEAGEEERVGEGAICLAFLRPLCE